MLSSLATTSQLSGTNSATTQLQTVEATLASHETTPFSGVHQTIDAVSAEYKNSVGTLIGTTVLKLVIDSVTYYVPCALILPTTPFSAKITDEPANASINNTSVVRAADVSQWTGVSGITYSLRAVLGSSASPDNSHWNFRPRVVTGSDPGLNPIQQVLVQSGVAFSLGSYGLKFIITWDTTAPLIPHTVLNNLAYQWSVQIISTGLTGQPGGRS